MISLNFTASCAYNTPLPRISHSIFPFSARVFNCKAKRRVFTYTEIEVPPQFPPKNVKSTIILYLFFRGLLDEGLKLGALHAMRYRVKLLALLLRGFRTDLLVESYALGGEAPVAYLARR